MYQRDRSEGGVEKLEGASKDVQGNAGDGAERGLFIENVGKGAAQRSESFFVAVNGERGFLADVERPNVVETQDVVGMAVGEQDGVEAVEPGAQGLLAEVGSGVDDDVLIVAREKQGRAQTIVAGVFGTADAAVTAESGHAHGGPGAKDGDFYGSGGHWFQKMNSKF